jgi:hypothetical protein
MAATDVVQYRAPDAIRWFSTPGVAEPGERKATRPDDWQNRLRGYLDSAMQTGKGAMDSVAKKKVEATAYFLTDTQIEIVGITTRKTVPFAKISRIVMRDDNKFTVEYEGGSFSIKPVAHMIAGTLKVALGWNRNGAEVPYRLLLEELAARSQVEIVPE